MEMQPPPTSSSNSQGSRWSLCRSSKPFFRLVNVLSALADPLPPLRLLLFLPRLRRPLRLLALEQKPPQNGSYNPPPTLGPRVQAHWFQVRLPLPRFRASLTLSSFSSPSPSPRPPHHLSPRPSSAMLVLDSHSKLPLTEEDVLYLFEEVYRARSVAPPLAVPSRPCLLRWRKEDGVVWSNLVVMDREEAVQ